MKECIEDGGDRDSCTTEMKDALKGVSNGISGLELDRELEKAAAVEAGVEIRTCMESAADAAAKTACYTNADVIEAISNATGIPTDQLTERKVKGFVEQSARAMVADLMKTCNEDASDDAAKKQCLTDAKAEVEALMGSSISGSKLQRFKREGAADDLMESLKACKGGGKSREECFTEGKSSFGKGMGKSGDPSKYEMEKALYEAATREVKELMDACKDDMGGNFSESAMTACKTSAKQALSDALGKDVSEKEFVRFLRKAADDGMRDILENCGNDKSACKAELKKGVAAAMGKREEDIKGYEVMEFKRKGSLKAAGDTLRDCRESAADDAAKKACLQTAEAEFKSLNKDLSSGGKSGPRNKQIQGMMRKEMNEALRETCMQEATKEEFKACVAADPDGVGSAMEDMFSGMSSDKKSKRKKAEEKNADIMVIGKQYKACMEVAADQSAKDACKTAVETDLAKTDVSEGVKAVLNRFRAKQMAQLVKDCEGTKQECRAQARAAMEAEYGEKPRKFAMMKKIGLIKDLAEAMAACMEEDGTDEETCKSEAESEYMEVTGRSNESFVEYYEKVKTIADAIVAGLETVIIELKQIDVEVGTSGNACILSIGQAITSKVEAEDANSAAGFDFGNVTDKPCMLTDGVPFYRVIVETPGEDDAAIEVEAERVAGTLESTSLGRRLDENLRRRLSETTTEVNSAQGVDEQVVTDAPTPAPTPDAPTPTPSPTDGGSPTPTPNKAGDTSSASRCGFFGLTFLAVVAIYVM